MRREVLHLLFCQGANAPIDKIKKECEGVYVKQEMFTETVLELSSCTTNELGTKLFRLDKRGGHEAIYEPFYIMKRT